MTERARKDNGITPNSILSGFDTDAETTCYRSLHKTNSIAVTESDVQAESLSKHCECLIAIFRTKPLCSTQLMCGE